VGRGAIGAIDPVGPMAGPRVPRLGGVLVHPGDPGHHEAVGGGGIGETVTVLLVDAANVVGSRPTGWWRDRPGAARGFVERVRATADAGRFAEPGVVVLEGAARGGVEEGETGDVRVVHAPGSGDDMLIALAGEATGQVTLVSADRGLRQRAEALGATMAGPGWFLDLLDG
jgi:hypothetical protein